MLKVSLFTGPSYLIEDEGTVSAHAFNVTDGVIPEGGLVVSVDAPNLSEFDLEGISIEGGEIVAVRDGGFDLRMTEYTTLVNLPIANDGETEAGETASFSLAVGEGYEIVEDYSSGTFNLVDTASDIPQGVINEPNDVIPNAVDTQISSGNPTFAGSNSIYFDIGNRYLNEDGTYTYIDQGADVDVYKVDLSAGDTITIEAFEVEGNPSPFDFGFASTLQIFDAEGNPVRDYNTNDLGTAPYAMFDNFSGLTTPGGSLSYNEFTAPEDGIYYLAFGGYGNVNDVPNNQSDPPIYDPLVPGSGNGDDWAFGNYDIEINLLTPDNPRKTGTPTPPLSNPNVTNPPTLSLTANPTTTDSEGNFTNGVVERVDFGETSGVVFTIRAEGEIPEGGIEFVLNSNQNLFDYTSWPQRVLPSTIGGQALGAFYDEEGIPTGIVLRIEEPTMTVTLNASAPWSWLPDYMGNVIDALEPFETDGPEDVTFFLQSGEGYEVAADAGTAEITYYDSIADVPPPTGGGDTVPEVGVTISETELIESEGTETTVTFTLSEPPSEDGVLVYLDSSQELIVGSPLSQFNVLEAEITGGDFPIPNGDSSGFFFNITEQTATITLSVFDELTVDGIDPFAVQEGVLGLDFALQTQPGYTIDPEASEISLTIADNPDSKIQVILTAEPETLVESEGTVGVHTFTVSDTLPPEGLRVSVSAPNLSEFDLDAIEVAGGSIAEVRDDGFDFTIIEQTATISLPVLDDGVDEGSETATFTLQPGDTYEINQQATEATFILADTVDEVSVPSEIEGNDTIAEANALGLSVQNPSISLTGEVDAGEKDPGEDVDFYTFNLEAGQTISLDIDTSEWNTLDSTGWKIVFPGLDDVQSPDTELRLFDAEGNELAANNDGAAPGEEFSRDPYIEFTAETAGTYYLGVSQLGNRNYDPNVARSGAGWTFPEVGVFYGPYELTARLEDVNRITPVADEFSDFYSAQSLGRVPLDTGEFVPAGYGGIAFLDDDTLLVTGNPYSSEAAIYEVDLVRDSDTNQITGFAAPATFLANAPGINITNPDVETDPDIEVGGLDGGLIVAPNGTLLYTTYFDNSIGQILPGTSDPVLDAFIDLTALGVDPASTGSLNIVPEGISGEGRLKITSFDNGNFYDALLVPNDDGTYDITIEGSVNLSPEEDDGFRGLEGLVYVDESYPGFTTDTVLISQYDTNTVTAFEVDALGNPILETETVFLDGLSESGGALFDFITDPVTGDLLLSLDSAFTADDTDLGGRLLLITDDAPPTAVADTDPFDDVTELDISSGSATASGAVSTSNDVYTIDAQAGELLTIDINVTEILSGITYTNDDTQLYLYNEAGDVLAFSEDKPSNLSSNILNYLVLEDGTYYAAVTTAGNEPILELGEVNQLLGFEETGLANVVYDITASATDVPDTARLFDIALELDPNNPIGNVLINEGEVLFIDLNGTRNTDATGVLPIEVNAEEVNLPENTLDNTLVFEDTLSFGLDVFDFILDFDEPFTSTNVDDIVNSLEGSGITAIIPPDQLIQRIVFVENVLPGTPVVSFNIEPDVVSEEGEPASFTGTFTVDGEIPTPEFDAEGNLVSGGLSILFDNTPSAIFAETEGSPILDGFIFGDYFDPETNRLEFILLEGTSTFTLNILNDIIQEEDESFTFTVFNDDARVLGSNYVVNPEASSDTVTLTDGVPPEIGPNVGISVSQTELTEGDEVTVNFDVDGDIPAEGLQVVVQSPTAGALGEFAIFDENGNFAIESQGITGDPVPYDGQGNSFLVTLTEPDASLTLNVFEDGPGEGTESLDFNLVDGEAYEVNADASSVSLSISEIPEISFSVNTTTLSEEEGTLFTFSFSVNGEIPEGGLEVALGGDLLPLIEQLDFSNFDFTNPDNVKGLEIGSFREDGSISLTLLETSGFVSVRVFDDIVQEADANFDLMLLDGDGYSVNQEAKGATVTVTDGVIIPNPPVVSLSLSDTNLSEGEELTVNFSVDGDVSAEEPLTVLVSSTEAGALGEFNIFDENGTPAYTTTGIQGEPTLADDIGSSFLVTLTQNEASITLPVFQDGIGEGTETFNFTVVDGERYDVDATNPLVALTIEETATFTADENGEVTAFAYDLSNVDAMEVLATVTQEALDITDAAFDNLVGFYEVVDSNGGIDTDGDGVADFNPGDTGYAKAALENAIDGIALRLGGDSSDDTTAGSFGDAVIQGGKFYAPFAIANGGGLTPEEFLEINPDNNAASSVDDQVAYFAYLGANPDGANHLKSWGDGIFGFEDLPSNLGVSDNDFNDAVFKFNFTA